MLALNMFSLFYSENVHEGVESVVLDEDASRHVVQVLRMRKGDQLELTNGKGSVFAVDILNDHKKKVEVRVQGSRYKEREGRRITIGISLLKNANRFEWFLEKATELGISEIIPLICERTERQHFRLERMKNILVSAMIQSRQFWLPMLQEPITFSKLFETSMPEQKFIAHCIESEKNRLPSLIQNSASSSLMLIGPEGDFTNEEVELALRHQFVPASLGETRLRAETAGVVAATLLRLI